jgi:hypothetical protein
MHFINIFLYDLEYGDTKGNICRDDFFLHSLIRTINSDQGNCCELTKKKMIF